MNATDLVINVGVVVVMTYLVVSAIGTMMMMTEMASDKLLHKIAAYILSAVYLALYAAIVAIFLIATRPSS